MNKFGNGIKNVFIEMSKSLAGWIDDTGTQLYKMTKKSSNQSIKTNKPVQKKKTVKPTKNTKTSQTKPSEPKPKPEISK